MLVNRWIPLFRLNVSFEHSFLIWSLNYQKSGFKPISRVAELLNHFQTKICLKQA